MARKKSAKNQEAQKPEEVKVEAAEQLEAQSTEAAEENERLAKEAAEAAMDMIDLSKLTSDGVITLTKYLNGNASDKAAKAVVLKLIKS